MFLRRRLLHVSLIASFLLLASRVPVYAVTILTPSSPITTVDDAVNAVCTSIRWFLFATIIATVYFGIKAGWDYVFSEGKDAETTHARKEITYAAIGALLALIALGVPQVMADFLGAGSVAACGF